MPRRDNVPLETYLKGLIVDRVDFCRAGSNGESDIVLFKRHNFRPVNKGTRPMPAPVEKTDAEKTAEIQKAIDDAVAAAVAKRDADVAAFLKAEAEKPEPTVDPVHPDPVVAKAINDAVAVEKAAREKTQTQLDELIEKDAERVFKAKADALPLVGSADEVASVLKGVARGETAILPRLEDLLKAANERIEKGDLFSERGTSRPGDTAEGTSRLMNAAKALMAADPALVLTDALTKAVKDDSTLLAEYRKSTRTA